MTAMESARLNILLVTSNGGHLDQLLRLRPWWEQHDRAWVSFDTPDVLARLDGETTSSAHHPTTRNIPNLVRNTFLAWRLLTTARPDVVVSAGAGLAVPFFLLSRLLGIRTVYVEVYDRISMPTLTGRLCAPFTDAFLLQWPEQKAMYPYGAVVGPLY
jgi:hypothetical protein